MSEVKQKLFKKNVKKESYDSQPYNYVVSVGVFPRDVQITSALHYIGEPFEPKVVKIKRDEDGQLGRNTFWLDNENNARSVGITVHKEDSLKVLREALHEHVDKIVDAFIVVEEKYLKNNDVIPKNK